MNDRSWISRPCGIYRRGSGLCAAAHLFELLYIPRFFIISISLDRTYFPPPRGRKVLPAPVLRRKIYSIPRLIYSRGKRSPGCFGTDATFECRASVQFSRGKPRFRDLLENKQKQLIDQPTPSSSAVPPQLPQEAQYPDATVQVSRDRHCRFLRQHAVRRVEYGLCRRYSPGSSRSAVQNRVA